MIHFFQLSPPTDAQIAAFNRAMNHIRESATARRLIEIIENGGVPFTLIFTNDHDMRYNFITNTIYWDPTSGLLLPDGSVQSAALGLVHEMGHAVQHLHGMLDNLIIYAHGLAPAGFNREREVARVEADNMARWKIPIARELGEPIRDAQYIGEVIRMNNSTHHRIIYSPGMDHQSPRIIPVNVR